MTPSLEGWPTNTKEAPSSREVRLALLDTNPVFQSLREKQPPTAPRNSSISVGYELQRLSGQHFLRKIDMVLNKDVVLKKKVSRLCKVCLAVEHSMDTQAGEKHKCPGQETSYKCAQYAVILFVVPCFSLYHQYKDY